MKDVLSETTAHLVPTNEEYQLGNERKLVCSAQVRLSQQAPLYIDWILRLLEGYQCTNIINIFNMTTHPPDNSINIFSPVSGNFSGRDTKKE